MRILFAGTPQPALPSLQRLIDSPHHEVVAVLSRPDAAAGRRGTSVPSPVGQLAIDAGIPLLRTARPNTGEFAAHLREFAPECCAVVAYGALLGPDLLAVPPHGWVNLHFSLLPAWRGAAPVQAAIAGGDTVTGATTFRLDAGLDTGPVYGVLTETIRPRDTAGELLDRLAVAGAGLLAATLDGIGDGVLSPVPQPAEGASLAPKITVEQARVRWDMPAHVVERRIRSVTPAPGAWTMIGNLRVKVGPVTVDDVGEQAGAEQSGPERSGPEQSGPERLGPGVFRIERSGVRVGTATQPVLLGQVQPPGKKAMAALDWVRGARFGDQVVAS